DEGAASFLRIDDAAVREIITYIGGTHVDHDMLRRLLLLARLGARPIRFGEGSTIVLLGSFWGLGEGVEQYLDAKRVGAGLAAYIYDVIPVSHPQYCDVNLSNAFWRALAALLHVADFVLTISDYTQHELKRLIGEYGGPQLPMATVPLAHSIGQRAASSGAWPRALEKIRGDRYVAYVSTVEGRKNHVYVVRAWQRMIAAGVKVPHLVFVGREGWKIDELTALLESTGNLGGRVHIVHGLSDAELAAVYDKALFTVFTSLTEGWGLPVGESLTHGVPCVASRAASIPEVGGDFVDYVDPDDLNDGVRVLTRMIEDDRYRAERRRNITAHFKARSWQDVGADLLRALAEMRAIAPPGGEVAPVRLSEAVIFRPGDIMGRQAPLPGYFDEPLALAMARSFYEPEPDGAWMRGGSGELTVRTTIPADGTAIIYVAVRPAPWAVDGGFSISIAGSGGRPRWMRLADGRNLLRIEAPVMDDGSCTLRFECATEPEPLPGDTRRFAVALTAIAYASAATTGTRGELRENFLFTA
ncbi:MAG: glycosyltransferase family 1 protein, partial [Rhizorhabdus sp.]